MPVGADDDTVAGDPYTSETAAATPALVAGRYRIVRWLGGGGMGRVYEVLDTELGEKVALKMLRGDLTSEALERFRREVRLTRRIQHPNVARMFDIGDVAGDRFLTMELIDGRTLTADLGTPMGWARMKPLADQICAGLVAAHDKGVVHRDLKPDNVMIERETDRIVLTDFGIARSVDDAHVTQTGMIIGTPRYMAPEQLAGAAVDGRADLFSFGVMLYELVTGTRPWLGDNAIAIAVAQATQPMRPLVTRSVPVGFVRLVEKLLEIDRDRRPINAAAVAAELAAITEHVETRDQLPHTVPVAAIAPETIPESTIAVLPFACAELDTYIAEGMREDLIDMLSTTPTLRVRPAGSVDPRTVDPRISGRDLGVDHVVVGSLRRTPTGVRVAARLIGVTDGFQIWAHRIDGAAADVLAIGDQLGQAIAMALSTRAANRTSLPTDPRAVELYLRARAELRRFWGEHALEATKLLEEAATIAPSSAQIAGTLAYATVFAWGKLNHPYLLAKARQYLERGLALDHVEAYLAASHLHWNLGDLDQCARDLRTAFERAPMSPQVHESVGRLLMEVESGQAGRRHLETASGLDPTRALIITADLARIDAFDGDLASAHRYKTQLMSDADPAIRQFAQMLNLRLAVWQRDVPAVVEALDQASRIRAGGLGLAGVMRTWHHEHVFDDVTWRAAVAEIATPDRPKRMQTATLQRAIEVAVLLGRLDEAIDCLQIASDAGLTDRVWLDELPMLAEITDPRWRALRDQVAARARRVLSIFRGG